MPQAAYNPQVMDSIFYIGNSSCTYHGHGSDVLDPGLQWPLLPDLEVEVDDLVSERGELVAEAELVGALGVGGPGE